MLKVELIEAADAREQDTVGKAVHVPPGLENDGRVGCVLGRVLVLLVLFLAILLFVLNGIDRLALLGLAPWLGHTRHEHALGKILELKDRLRSLPSCLSVRQKLW